MRQVPKVARAWPNPPVSPELPGVAESVVALPRLQPAAEAEWGCPSGGAWSKRGLRAEAEVAGGWRLVPLPGPVAVGRPAWVCSAQGVVAELAARLLPERVPAVALGAVELHPVPVEGEPVWLPEAQAVLAHAAPRCCAPWIRETSMSR